MDCLKVSKAELKVYIHPSKNKDFYNAVLREISTMLFTYSEIFDGIVLAYDSDSPDLKPLITSNVEPVFGVKLKVNLLLFSPKPDMLLEGRVIKVTPESIHAVVLGLSSAIITEKDIREEFVYRTKHGQEVYASKSHKRHVIKGGTVIRFLVKSFDKEILYVYGSLIPDHTGNIQWLDKNLEASHADRSAKKREIKGEPLVPDQDVIDGKPSTFVQKIKNAKKQKIKEES